MREGTRSRKQITYTYIYFNPVKVKIAFMDFSSRYFIVCSSLSVHAASSTSPIFELDDIEEETRGKMYSRAISSTVVL